MKNGKESCAIFIDVENMPDLQPLMLLNLIKSEFQIRNKLAFADYSQKNIGPVAARLSSAGIEMIHVVSRRNGMGREKDIVDEKMADEVLEFVKERGNEISTVFIASGDGHFENTVVILRHLGKRAVIVANPNRLSNRLLEKADALISLNGNGAQYIRLWLLRELAFLEKQYPYLTRKFVTSRLLERNTHEKTTRKELFQALDLLASSNIIKEYAYRRRGTELPAIRLNRYNPIVKKLNGCNGSTRALYN